MKKENSSVKINSFIYSIFKFCSKVISKIKLNLKVVKNELKGNRKGFVVIANHESMIDFFALAANLPKSSFVVSSSFYNTLPIKGLMKLTGVISKQQFQTLPSDLIKMKEVVNADIPLIIYPAGLMCEDGIATPIPESTGKFLKWLKKDVYVAKIKGTYLTKPKWSKKWRKGKTSLEIYKLIDKHSLNDMSNEEVFDLINSKLYFNAYLNQKEDKIPFKNGDNIVGLESVLYKCPKCGEEFKIQSKDKNVLVCSNCGNSCKADKYGFLNKINEDDIIYSLPSEWSTYIQEELFKEISNNDDYSLKDDAEVFLLDIKERKYKLAGNVTLTLDKENIVLKGVVNDEYIEKEFTSNQFISLPFIPNQHFEIQEGNVSWRIRLKHPLMTTKWVWSLEMLYKLKAECKSK